MRFSEIKSSVLSQFAKTNRVVVYIDGKPGGGKSSVCREIAAELCKIHNIPEERVVEFNPSLREPTDILGIPDLKGDHSEWLPPQEFYAIRKGTGPAVLIVEELSDASMDMQNPLCRILLDRHAGNLPLTDELYILASGNRTEDKSGANRLSTKLGNRMRTLHFEENLDDWINWAAEHGVSPVLRQFIKWRPNLLSDFDPKRSINPTPRSWADVALIPEDMPSSCFYEHVAGSVGDGAAAEYVGFLKIFKSLPDFEKIMKDPANAEVPSEPSVLYATIAKIASVLSEGTTATKKKRWSALYQYIDRFAPEFAVMAVKESMRSAGGVVTGSKEFIQFATKHTDVLMGS